MGRSGRDADWSGPTPYPAMLWPEPEGYCLEVPCEDQGLQTPHWASQPMRPTVQRRASIISGFKNQQGLSPGELESYRKSRLLSKRTWAQPHMFWVQAQRQQSEMHPGYMWRRFIDHFYYYLFILKNVYCSIIASQYYISFKCTIF